MNQPSKRPTIFDLNVVQTSPSYQLQGLHQFQSSGVPVEMIELGNELFDVYQGGWPTGAGYRAAMEPYIEEMTAAFPQAKVALVGHEFHGGRSAVAWNQEIFNCSGVNCSTAHAATIHIYTIVSTRGLSVDNVAWKGPQILQSAWQFPGAQHGFFENTIPPQVCP